VRGQANGSSPKIMKRNQANHKRRDKAMKRLPDIAMALSLAAAAIAVVTMIIKLF